MHGATRKETPKRLQDIENLIRKKLQLKDSVNSGLKATKIIGQRKALNKDKMDMQNCASASSIHELC